VGQASRLSLTSFIRLNGKFSFRHIHSPDRLKKVEAGDRRDACPAGWLQACCLAAFGCAVVPLWGATNTGREDEILKLSPPHAELPPSFWEQYGVWILLAAVVLVALAAF